MWIDSKGFKLTWQMKPLGVMMLICDLGFHQWPLTSDAWLSVSRLIFVFGAVLRPLHLWGLEDTVSLKPVRDLCWQCLFHIITGSGRKTWLPFIVFILLILFYLLLCAYSDLSHAVTGRMLCCASVNPCLPSKGETIRNFEYRGFMAQTYNLISIYLPSRILCTFRIKQ